ncbi:MAG: indolepyruvate oxidoreductase subunit beta [Phycisphaerae bacterium]
MTASTVTNVVVAGLGGQGVLKASDILAEAAFRAGMDVKKAEIHGMSQRGGSVHSDVRFGSDVLSPMVPAAQADFLVVLEPTQVEVNSHRLSQSGTLIGPDAVDVKALSSAKSLNVAMLGALSKLLPIGQEHWKAAIAAALPKKLHEVNFEAFEIGRNGKSEG